MSLLLSINQAQGGGVFDPQRWAVLTGQQFQRAEALALRDFAEAYEARMIRERMSGQRGNIGVNRITGRLVRSFHVAVVHTEGASAPSLFLRINFGVPYAAVHEYGGAVRRAGHNVRGHTVNRGGQTFYRSPHFRRSSVAHYKARLGARETLLEMLPELGAMMQRRVDDILRGSRFGNRWT